MVTHLAYGERNKQRLTRDYCYSAEIYDQQQQQQQEYFATTIEIKSVSDSGLNKLHSQNYYEHFFQTPDPSLI